LAGQTLCWFSLKLLWQIEFIPFCALDVDLAGPLPQLVSGVIYAKGQKKWQGAFDLATELVATRPNRIKSWIRKSQALQKLGSQKEPCANILQDDILAGAGGGPGRPFGLAGKRRQSVFGRENKNRASS
jgi:hypothetical protein